MNAFDFCCGLILSLIICFGIFGNTLSFLLWTKGRRCKRLPGGIYLRALAISDNLALLAPAMSLAVNLVADHDPAAEYNFICKLEIFSRHFGLLVSTWIIVCFTLGRTITILRPASSGYSLSKKWTGVLMVVIYGVNFLLNLPFGVVYGVTETAISPKQQPGTDFDPNSKLNISDNITFDKLENGTEALGLKRQCSADISSFFHFLNWYHIWFMDAFLLFIIPFGLMTGSNFMVLYLVVGSKKSAQSKVDSKVWAVTMRAVTISVVHCVTSGPFSMGVLIPGFFARAMSVKYSKEYYIARISIILAYTNHAVNFLLYSFFGSEFRRDCAEMLKKMRPSVKPQESNEPTGDALVSEDRAEAMDTRSNKPDDSKTIQTAIESTA